MTALASGDVTYTLNRAVVESGSGFKRNEFTIAFGDGAKTYPSGGVPLLKGSLGCPNAVVSAWLEEPNRSSGYVYKLDLTNLKLTIWLTGTSADTALNVAGAGVAPAAQSLRLVAVGY